MKTHTVKLGVKCEHSVLVELGKSVQSASPFVVGRAETRVSGRNRIEKDADSRAKGMRGEGSRGLT